MRALVLGGAGAVCKETTKDLSQYSQFEQIVVADHNLPAAASLVESLGDERVSAMRFDARDEEEMRRLFPQFDIIVNGLPFQFDYAVNKACVEVGVNGLDLSSDDPQFGLHAQALGKDMLFVPGVGATPGITNMMVRRAAEALDELSTVEIYFAAFRSLAPAPGLLQTTLWEFNPEVEERHAVYYEGGEWHPTPPLSGERSVEFHEHIGDKRFIMCRMMRPTPCPRPIPACSAPQCEAASRPR
jgi:saccharopine dehydrogenase-like NADP-dependent oxidoreductase